MANVDILRDKITAVSDSVRRRTGMTNDISLDDLPSYIRGISGSVGHMEVASIIGDGASWINTNICPNPQWTIEMRCRLIRFEDGMYEPLFGCRRTTDTDFEGSLGLAYHNTEDGEMFAYYSNGYTATRQSYAIEGYTKQTCGDFKTYKFSKGIFSIDGVDLHTFTTSTNRERLPYPLWLFSRNVSSWDEPGDANTTCMEMIYCKMWDDDGELILDLIPVLKSNGVVCLYNKVNSSYLYNEGSGTFTYSLFVGGNVTYHVDTGVFYTEERDENEDCLHPESFETPTKEGYTFLGWANSGYDVLTECNMGTEGINLYAIYSKDIPVTYLRDEGDTTGQVEESVTVRYSADGTMSTTFTLPRCTFTKENYTFDGWVCSIDGATYTTGLITTDLSNNHTQVVGPFAGFTYEGEPIEEILFYPNWMYSIYLLDPNGINAQSIFFNSDGSNLSIYYEDNEEESIYVDNNLNYALMFNAANSNASLWFSEPIYIRDYTKLKIRALRVHAGQEWWNGCCFATTSLDHDGIGWPSSSGYKIAQFGNTNFTEDYFKELTGNPDWTIDTALNDINDPAWCTIDIDLTTIDNDYFYLAFDGFGIFYVGDVQLLAPEPDTTIIPLTDTVGIYENCYVGTSQTNTGDISCHWYRRGNYVDSDGKQWLYDYIDTARQKKVHIVGSTIFDGSEDEGWYVTYTDATESSGVYRTMTKHLSGVIKGCECGVNRIPPAALINFTDNLLQSSKAHPYSAENTISVHPEGYIDIRHPDFTTYDITKWTSHLAANPVTAYYELANPIETDLTDKYIINPAGTSFNTTFLTTEGTAQSGYTALDTNNVGAAFGYANDGDGYVFTIKQWSSLNYQGFVFNDLINCADYKYLRIKYLYCDLEVESNTLPAVARVNLAKDKTQGSNGMTANNYKSVDIGGEYTLSYYRDLLGDDTWCMEKALEDASNAAWMTVTIDISDIDSFYLGFQASNALFIYDAVLSNNKEDEPATDVYIINPNGTDFASTYLNTDGSSQSGWTLIGDEGAYKFNYTAGQYKLSNNNCTGGNNMGVALSDPIDCSKHDYLKVKYFTCYTDIGNYGGRYQYGSINIGKNLTRGSWGHLQNVYKSPGFTSTSDTRTVEYYRELLNDSDWTPSDAYNDTTNGAWSWLVIDISSYTEFYLNIQGNGTDAVYIAEVLLSNSKDI